MHIVVQICSKLFNSFQQFSGHSSVRAKVSKKLRRDSRKVV
jgi:hypothetical protein